MTRAVSATLLGHLRTLTTASSAANLPDGELLLRFTAARDEAAFTTLLRRHGPVPNRFPGCGSRQTGARGRAVTCRRTRA